MPLAFPTLDAAIAHAEGFGKPGAIPTIANNPGDIIMGPFAKSQGATGSITALGGQEIAIFPDTGTGYAAMDKLIQNKYSAGTLNDLASKWLSGSSQMDIDAWTRNVTGQLGGVPSSTPVSATAGSGSGPDTPATSPGIATKIAGAIAAAVMSIPGAKGTKDITKAATLLFGVPIATIAAFALGLIAIAGGLYLFKPVQSAVRAAV